MVEFGGLNMKNRTAFKAAFPYTIPVLAGYLFMGMAFGILLQSKGYHFGWAFFMALFMYAGSMQFVAINLLTGGFHLLHTAFMTLMVNARHLFYGLSMLEKFKNMGSKKPYMVFSLTDETYSLLCSVKPPDHVDKNWFYFFIALLNQSYWITGCTLGAILGSLITFNSKGIDFVMTALFVVIFIGQWKSNPNHMPACIGVGTTVLCLLIFGATNFLLPSMLCILVLLTVMRKKIEENHTHDLNR